MANTAKTKAAQAAPAPRQAYAMLVAEGTVKPDAAQGEALEQLQALYEALSKKRRFGKTAIKGLYIYGEVGRGKSMLMDLFFNAAPLQKKRRVHFHAFMQEVHARIHTIRQHKQADPVGLLVSEIAKEVQLLCFDELQATDVADATLLYRLFSGLIEAGITIVATGNRPPEAVYQGGVQAERFAKFITLLREEMDVLSLNGNTDYRTTKTQSQQQVYFYPLGNAAERFVESWIKGKPQSTANLEVHGRTLTLRSYGEMARATFADLCEQPLGAADYLAIAQQFPTLILENIPILTADNRNEAKRLVLLIDALYEAKSRLICTAAAAAESLYPQGHGSFEFQRTVSRLKEMQSAKYLA